MSELTFSELQKASLERCQKHFPSCADWTLNDWAVALAGEVGELCNRLKKARRGDFAYTLIGQHGRVSRDEVLKELADTIIYADLMISRLGARTGEVVAGKFNEVSQKVGFPTVLPSAQSDLNALAHSLAYEFAVSVIESNCVQMDASAMHSGDWWDVDEDQLELELEDVDCDAIETVGRCVYYLEQRGLLERHPEQREWVSLRDESEATA